MDAFTDPVSASSNAAPENNPPKALSPEALHFIYRGLSTYPFHTDQEYHAGLATILGHPGRAATPKEITDNADLVVQTQCFYFSR